MRRFYLPDVQRARNPRLSMRSQRGSETRCQVHLCRPVHQPYREDRECRLRLRWPYRLNRRKLRNLDLYLVNRIICVGPLHPHPDPAARGYHPRPTLPYLLAECPVRQARPGVGTRTRTGQVSLQANIRAGQRSSPVEALSTRWSPSTNPSLRLDWRTKGSTRRRSPGRGDRRYLNPHLSLSNSKSALKVKVRV